jgi:hypothetical protein
MSTTTLIAEAVRHFDDADELSIAAHFLLEHEAGSPEVHSAAKLLVQAGLRRNLGVAAVREAWAAHLVVGCVAATRVEVPL